MVYGDVYSDVVEQTASAISGAVALGMNVITSGAVVLTPLSLNKISVVVADVGYH